MPDGASAWAISAQRTDPHLDLVSRKDDLDLSQSFAYAPRCRPLAFVKRKSGSLETAKVRSNEQIRFALNLRRID
jgi:hypothetical protein